MESLFHYEKIKSFAAKLSFNTQLSRTSNSGLCASVGAIGDRATVSRFVGWAGLGLAAMSALQTLSAWGQQADTAKHYYRLTFTISAHGSEPAQDYILNVPVAPGKPGMAELNIASGAMSDTPGRAQQALEASDVQETASGVRAKVQYVSESQKPAPPGMDEPIINNFRFEQQVEVPLGKSTKITKEAKVIALGGDTKQPPPPPPPQIFLTVEKL